MQLCLTSWVKPRGKGVWVGLVMVLSLLWWQAHSAWWRGHLAADSVTFFERANYFFENQQWGGMFYNEHIPGTLWFFALVGWFAPWPLTFEGYLESLVAINIILLVAHFVFFWRSEAKWAPWLFVIMLATMGPILLFRFELIVSLLVLVGWNEWRRGKITGAVWWGVATAIKIYPLVILPLLVLEAGRRKRWQEMGLTILWFGVGLGAVIGSYLLLGGSVPEALAALEKHKLKPIGLEGIWSLLILIGATLTDFTYTVSPGYGIHGLMIAGQGGEWIQLVFLLLIILSFGWTGWYYRSVGYVRPEVLWFILVIFVTMGKVLNPHYLWWAFVFFPLMTWDRFRQTTKGWLFFLVGMMWILTQIVYPIYYTAFLDWFYQRGGPFLVVYLNMLRNVILVGLIAWVGYLIRQKWLVVEEE